MTGAFVRRAGEAERRWLGEVSTSFLAEGEDTGGRYALVDETAPCGEQVPLHRHPDDDESFYVVDGEVTFFLGGAAGARVGPGSFVHVPGGTVHGFRVESETARYLILTTPRHGAFYRAITAPSRPGGLPPLQGVEGAQIARAAREYGIERVGPLPGEG